MNLKYATLGLISGYLAGYVLEYLSTNSQPSSLTNPIASTSRTSPENKEEGAKAELSDYE